LSKNPINLLELIIDIDRYSSYSLFFRKICGDPKSVQAQGSGSPPPGSTRTVSPVNEGSVSFGPLRVSDTPEQGPSFSLFRLLKDLFLTALYALVIGTVGVIVYAGWQVCKQREGVAQVLKRRQAKDSAKTNIGDEVELQSIRGRGYGTLG
jgi:hypothetical protein